MGGREKPGQQPTGFGALLKSVRDAAGMSQQDLAVAAKMSIGGYQKIEQGTREPAWPTVLQLADALHVSPEVFVPPPMKVVRDGENPWRPLTPIVSDIPAGRPSGVDAIAYERISLGDQFPEEDLVAYRVRGESMIDEHIEDGDIVVVRPQSVAEAGEIVVATIDGELTLKKLRRIDGEWWLYPRNRDTKVSPIQLRDVDDPRILGVYIGSQRRTVSSGRGRRR